MAATIGKLQVTTQDVTDEFIREEGRLNFGLIRDRVGFASPWITYFNATTSSDDNQPIKREWPHNVGSTFTTTILTDVKADPVVGEGWSSYANSACAWQFQVIDFGSKKVSACLEKYAARTKDFCLADLQWDWQLSDQVDQYRAILRDYSQDVWHYWLQASYAKCSRNLVLNQALGYPSDIGVFPAYGPTSILTYDHLKRITKDFLIRRGRADQSPAMVDGGKPKFLVFLSQETYDHLEESYRQYHINKLGYRPTNIKQIEAFEYGGELESFGNWIFVILQYPRRYVWNDLLNIYHDGDGVQRPIPQWIRVRTTRGWESVDNTRYDFGTGKAHEHLVEETYILNSAAMHWLVPSDFTAMDKTVSAADYMGIFKFWNKETEADPDAESAHFYAKFVAGAKPHRPERGLTIRALVPRRAAADIGPEAGFPKPQDHTHVYPILEVFPRIESGELHIVTTAQLPVQCPMGTRLVIRTQGHGEAEITAVTGGTGRMKEMLQVYDYVLTLSPSNLAAVRSCDPWKQVMCKPETEACQPVANDADCPTCAAGACETKCYAVTIDGSTFTSLTDAEDNTVLFSGDLPANVSDDEVLADIQAALNAYIAGNGSAEIVYDSGDTEFTVTILDTTEDMTAYAINGTAFSEIDCPA